MWACSWYVGSNVSTERPGPGVRQQQRLQHLVGAVGGEDLLGGDAVPVARSPCAGPGGAIGVAVPVDRAEPGRDLVAPAGRRRERRLVRVEAHLDVDLRRVVALQRPQVVAHRHEVGSGPACHTLATLLAGCERWLMSSSAVAATAAELSAAAEAVAGYQRRVGALAGPHLGTDARPRRGDLRGRAGAAHGRAAAPAAVKVARN